MPKKSKVQNRYYEPGDLFTLPSGLECIVLEIDEWGDATKLEAMDEDLFPELLKNGWFEEGHRIVTFNYDILTDN